MNLNQFADIQFFSDLNEQQSQILTGIMHEKVLTPGATIFTQGERAFSCYFILEGTVHVQVKSDDANQFRKVATLRKGELLGELALIDGGLRSATCKVGSEKTILAELRRDDFEQILHAGNAFAFKLLDNISVALVDRLRQTSRQLMQIVNASNNETSI